MIDAQQLKAESAAVASVVGLVDAAAQKLSPLAQLALATGIARSIFKRIAGLLDVSYPKLVALLAERLMMPDNMPGPSGDAREG